MFDFIATALAAPEPCALIATGCDPTVTAPAAVNSLIVTASRIFVLSVSALCVLLTVWGGTLMAFSFGDDSRVTRGRNSILYGVVGFAIALLSQTIINYATNRAVAIRAGDAGSLILNAIAEAIATLTTVYNVTVLFVIIFGGFRYVLSRGNTEQADGARKMVQWAIIGGICINSARIIAELVVNTGI